LIFNGTRRRPRTWPADPNPLIRYKCSACGKTFNALAGTPLARPQRRDAWLKYAQALADGVSLGKAAKRCRIALDTAFRWRHRIGQGQEGDERWRYRRGG
jgi:transposase-like protein